MAKAKKKKYDTGVYPLPSGNWAYRFKITVDGEVIAQRRTKDVYGVPYQTKKQAVDARRAAIKAAKAKEPIDGIPIAEPKTVKEVFLEYCEKGRADRAYNTVLKQNSLWNNYLRDKFGDRCVEEISVAEVQDYLAYLYHEKGYAFRYRAVFEVKKLDEGWDVLNLFDIVRLYETRQSSGNRISQATVSEAQLIGRGARYCPFVVEAEQVKDKRKYDTDLDNPMRICEELHYHCQNDSRYIGELNNALREMGVDLENQVVRTYVLKDRFKTDALYTDGFVFMNDRVVVSRNNVDGLLPSVRDHLYTVRLATGSSGEDTLLGTGTGLTERQSETRYHHTTIAEIAALNYAIVHKALCQYSIFKFNILRSYFPNLKSTREFITSPKYLGGIKLEIASRWQNPAPAVLYTACVNVLGKISESISAIEETFTGTLEFRATRIRDIFKDKKCNYSVVHAGGIGYSQNDQSVPTAWKIDLSQEDWFAFEDNFGTSEEKAFVAYFKAFIPQLREKYDKVFLVRNERQLHIYSFDGGERFEPDYVLFLHSPKAEGYEQLQVFIEPKGTHLVKTDQWKEDFLLEIESKAVATKVFVDDNEYKICGFHFFNQEVRLNHFAEDMNRLL